MNEEEKQRLREALESLTGELDGVEADKFRLYEIEQHERANELYEAAVGDGIPFAIVGESIDDDEDVYVNTKWLSMLVRSAAIALVAVEEPSNSTLALAEILSQTVMAANKFVGREI